MIVGQQTNGEPGIAPVALNDAFALGAVGQLNVLDNDQLRSNPGRRVVAVEQPLNGGVVVVSPQMNGVIYTPPGSQATREGGIRVENRWYLHNKFILKYYVLITTIVMAQSRGGH